MQTVFQDHVLECQYKLWPAVTIVIVNSVLCAKFLEFHQLALSEGCVLVISVMKRDSLLEMIVMVPMKPADKRRL